jgi:eukaryotic-like serine/threonine-protein kinase
VAVYDTGEETDPVTGSSIPYIVMELVEGQTLREMLREGRKLLPERALEIRSGCWARCRTATRPASCTATSSLRT